MQTLVRKKFDGQDVVIDGSTTYVKCTFTKCHFFYSGSDWTFMECQITEPTITFTGEAGKTFAFLQMLGMVAPPQQPPQVPPAIGQAPDSGTLH